MFIAHLPAGYLLTRFLQRKLKTPKYLWVGLLASVLPDFDLLYFYLVDHRQTLHHEYWIHLPVHWLSISLLAVVLLLFTKNRKYFLISTIFLGNIFLHLLLDTFVAGILWLYPFSRASFHLATVPARYPFWVENFAFHWTFMVEIIIIIWALVEFWKSQMEKAGEKV